MKNLTKISLSIICLVMAIINTNSLAGNRKNLLMEKDGVVYFKIKTNKGKDVVTKYLSIYGSEVKDQSVLSKEEADRLLGKTSARRHIVNVIPKESVVLYSLIELLDKYKIDNVHSRIKCN
jgi:uncharacterized protein YycO